MVAMSLLLGCSSPRPPRPRWRSTGRRRSTTHPQGRNAAEDGGGETFLAREELAQPGSLHCGVASPGEESRAGRHCGKAMRLAVLWPDHAIKRPRGRAPDSRSRRRRGRHGSVQEARLNGRRNRNPGVRKGGPSHPGPGQRSHCRHRGLSAADRVPFDRSVAGAALLTVRFDDPHPTGP
jgi:hypothetical protein